MTSAESCRAVIATATVGLAAGLGLALAACSAAPPPSRAETVIVVLPPQAAPPPLVGAAAMPGTDGGMSTDGPMPSP